MVDKIKRNNGITLISLIITIVIMLILAAVSLNLIIGDNGIVSKTKLAKDETEIQREKEEILTTVCASEINDENDNNNLGELSSDGLQKEFDDQYGENKYIVTYVENKVYVIEITETHRKYKVENDNVTLMKKVLDKVPGVLSGEGTSDNPYLIESIEDLVCFANDVKNGNTYENKYVSLGTSLDFNDDNSYVDSKRNDYCGYIGELKQALTTGEGFKTIGTTIFKDDANSKANSFCGTFDGKNNIISNVYINKNPTDWEIIGFFGGYIYGTVENLNLNNVNFKVIDNVNQAGIAGFAGYLTGSIINCKVSGNITGISESTNDINCSGIIVYNAGDIESCANLAKIYGEIKNTDSEGGCYCGGITVNNQKKIENTYNSGDIYTKVKKGRGQLGGIARLTSWNNTVINNCYNKGNLYLFGENSGILNIGGISSNTSIIDSGCTIKINNVYNIGNLNVTVSNAQELYVGGIIGLLQTDNYLTGAYNLGTITLNQNASKSYAGEICGKLAYHAYVNNCYYTKNNGYGEKDTSYINNLNMVNEADLKGDTIFNSLNSNGAFWKKDSNNINSGYPIFTWQ